MAIAIDYSQGTVEDKSHVPNSQTDRAAIDIIIVWIYHISYIGSRYFHRRPTNVGCGCMYSRLKLINIHTCYSES